MSVVARGWPGLVVPLVLTASSAAGDTSPAPTTVLSLGCVSREDETDQEEIEDATDVMPLRRGTDSEKYENGTSKEGQKRDAGQVQVQRRREGCMQSRT